MGTFGAIVAVAIGGAAGSLLRYAAAQLMGARPLTTFAVNLTGAFLIGVLAALSQDAKLRLLVGTGFLGGYTTFSAWQLEALTSARAGDWLSAFLNLAGSTILGFAAVAAGYSAGLRFR